jgi:hypothetical protein
MIATRVERCSGRHARRVPVRADGADGAVMDAPKNLDIQRRGFGAGTQENRKTCRRASDLEHISSWSLTTPLCIHSAMFLGRFSFH